MILQLEPLPGDVAHLLLRGATQLEPSAHTRQRLRQRLAADVENASDSRTLVVAPANGLGSGFGSSRLASLAGRALRSRLMIGLAGFALGAGSAAVARAPRRSTPSALRAVPRPALETFAPPAARAAVAQAAQSAVAPAARPAIVGRKVSARIVAPRAATPPAVPTFGLPTPVEPVPLAKSELRLEGDLLERGRIAMVRGDAEGALEAADEHATRFPAGNLAEEREALRIQALVAQDRAPEARAAFDAFRRIYPQSLVRPALEAAIGR